ncbi:MAG: phospho-N-acetylmuramoyl-pentapeptide-transferase [Eubacterium sp.]|nr:phospho-N-acetylmuramoyl-pentapeptide-transferase [Eubacterium sp.]
MLYSLLSGRFSDIIITVIAAAVGFVSTFLVLARPPRFLPRDGGKFIVDKDGNRQSINEKSNGKVTGAGLIFVIIFFLCALLFLPFSVETLIYLVLGLFMMLTGYLDDTSINPWRELVKGILDLILSVSTVVVFLVYNSSKIYFFGMSFNMPIVVYAILGTMLIWASINVTNCTDGVDGLSGTVAVIELFTMFVLFRDAMAEKSGLSLILAFVLLAYLAYNWHPSSVLMGDAGSRTVGYVIALICMLSGHPFIFLLVSLVFIFDGGLGLLKLAVMRVFKIKFLDKIRFPFHDELRKVKGWSVAKIVVFFTVWQIIDCLIAAAIVKFI